ncbi:unnamed protein product [Coregonus sp. 'balchen']|nr:unnamed protein product [Coregonus sp. 'balchen']
MHKRTKVKITFFVILVGMASMFTAVVTDHWAVLSPQVEQVNVTCEAAHFGLWRLCKKVIYISEADYNGKGCGPISLPGVENCTYFKHFTPGDESEIFEVKTQKAGPYPRYRYDAFVSYSGKDERWVVEQLLPNLEQRGPPFLRLCLHSRDFQQGKDIVDNITASLYVTSCAHRDILILVFLEDIPHRQLSAHHCLARMVKTRTYLDWHRDMALQPAFWDRLWTKLAAPEPQPRL